MEWLAAVIGGLVGGIVGSTLRTTLDRREPTKVIIVGDERERTS